MGSTEALALFSAFILVGFVIEARGRKNVTRAAWLPLLWMIICASRSVDQWLNPFQSNSYIAGTYIEVNLRGNLTDQIVLGTAVVLGIIVIYKRREWVVGIFKNNKALLALIIYLGITVLWSDVGQASFRRWIRLVGNFVMASVLMTEPEPLESLRSIFRRAAYLLIPASVMAIKYFPQIGTSFDWEGFREWSGIALQKNGLGHLCFVASFFLIWDTTSTGENVEIKYPAASSGVTHPKRMKFPRVLFDMIIMIMCLWLLRGAASSSSIACLVLGLAMVIGSKVPAIKRNFGKLGMLVTSAACLFLVLQLAFPIVPLIVHALGRDMTFTGRDMIWGPLLDMGMRQPFLGYGYGGFWTAGRAAIAWQETGLRFLQSHNGYLEIFLEGGLVAITLLGALLISVFRKIQRDGVTDYENAVFRFCLFVMILLANFTESSFMRERDLLTFVFFIIALDHKSFRKSSGDRPNLEENEVYSNVVDGHHKGVSY